jgi:hypothetical protein
MYGELGWTGKEVFITHVKLDICMERLKKTTQTFIIITTILD